jgi:Ca2+-binding EF-hand superfamily protein
MQRHLLQLLLVCQDDVTYAFNLARELDKNKDGRITAKEFQVFWTKQGKPVPNNLVPYMTDVFGSTNVTLAHWYGTRNRMQCQNLAFKNEL